ncbi:MAG: SDR family oxidoreductase [Desulfomonilia bacterium]
MMSGRYQGKTVYITGGSSGIGLCAAKLFSSMGAHVLIVARTVDTLQSAASEIERHRAADGQRISWRSMDVSDREQVNSYLTEAVKEFGIPDIVINSAGQSCSQYFEKTSQETFDRIIRTNLYGIWNVLSFLVPFMKPSGGHIVNISSIAGFLGVFGFSAYCASKFAVIGLSQSLRSELKPHNIRVSVLCPPDTDTPMLERENTTKPPETKALSEGAGIMSPDAVARAMIRGMEKKRFMILPGIEGKTIHLAYRIFPSLVERIMESKISRVQKSH